MDDFHNQFNGYSSQKEKQTIFKPRAHQKTNQISHPLLFTPPHIMDKMILKNEQKQPFQTNTISNKKKDHDSTLEHEKQVLSFNRTPIS